jgi:hypothetical protein
MCTQAFPVRIVRNDFMTPGGKKSRNTKVADTGAASYPAIHIFETFRRYDSPYESLIEVPGSLRGDWPSMPLHGSLGTKGQL